MRFVGLLPASVLLLTACSSGGLGEASGSSSSSTGGAGGATSTATSASASGAGGSGGSGGVANDDAPFAAQRLACAFKAGALPADTFGASIAMAKIPIDTFVLVVQENRSFDHYLSALPAAGQTDVDVASPQATIPDASNVMVSRFHQTDYCFGDTNHGWDGQHKSWDDGMNDGFIKANNPGGQRSLGYFEQSDLPFLYGLATTYGTGDRYFCPTLTQTGPNRLYLYGATSLGTVGNSGGPPGFVSIFDAFIKAGLSFGVYMNNGYSFEGSIFPKLQQDHPKSFGSLADFDAAAKADKLPHLVFLYVGPDEHPPADMQKGQVEVQKAFTSLSKSPSWMHSAFILTYDENGGLYDHVPPPPACAPDDIAPMLAAGDAPGGFDRYGFRVPFVVASAWSKPHFVSHTVHDHTSILRLLELRFGLPALTARDANANSLLEYFDWSTPSFATPPALPQGKVDAAHACQ